MKRRSNRQSRRVSMHLQSTTGMCGKMCLVAAVLLALSLSCPLLQVHGITSDLTGEGIDALQPESHDIMNDEPALPKRHSHGINAEGEFQTADFHDIDRNQARDDGPPRKKARSRSLPGMDGLLDTPVKTPSSTLKEYSPAVRCFFTKPETVKALYKMMKDVDELFQASGVQYWAEFGTLMGAKRHKGLMPWDDDLDIMVLSDAIPKIQGLAAELKKRGYGMVDQSRTFSMFRLYDMNGPQAPSWGSDSWDPALRFPWMDIDIGKKVMHNGEYYVIPTLDAESPVSPKSLKDYHSLRYSWVEPRTQYTFGGSKIWGPAKADEWLKEGYGADFMNVGVITKDHVHDSSKKNCEAPEASFAIPANAEAAKPWA